MRIMKSALRVLSAVLIASNPLRPGVPSAPEQGREPKPATRSSKPGSRPSKQDALAALRKLLVRDRVDLELEKGRVLASGKVTITDDLIEYVAVGPRGKKHETLVTLFCKGSTLNAALLALGLKKGKNARLTPIEPPPTREEVEKGAPTAKLTPPSGQKVYLALRWSDEEEKEHTVAIEDLILDIQTGKPLQGADWIYFGGRMKAIYRGEPPVFVADYEQNYISNYYVYGDNHLITIRHPRARNDQNWFPNDKLLPPRGTDCKLIISKSPVVPRLKTEEKDGTSRPASRPGKKEDGGR